MEFGVVAAEGGSGFKALPTLLAHEQDTTMPAPIRPISTSPPSR
jgi:hypothetical protein